MPINIDSEMQCRRAYISYLERRECSGISEEEFIQIKTRYSDKLSEWLSMPSDDVNEYAFGDEDFERFNARGRDAAENIADYDGSAIGNTAQASTNAVTATGNVIWTGSTGGVKALEQAGSDIAGGIKNALGIGKKKTPPVDVPDVGHVKVSTEGLTGDKLAAAEMANRAQDAAAADAAAAAQKAADKQATTAYVQAGIAVAQAAYYWIDRPNQEEKAACDELLNQMANNEMALNDQSGVLKVLQEDIMLKSQETADANAKANDDIKFARSNQFLYQSTINRLEAKKSAGQELTIEEKNTLTTYKGYVRAEEGNVTQIADEITAFTKDSIITTDEMAGDYDDVAGTIAEVQGVVDYAASIDKAAQASAYMEAVGQGLNAASGAMAAAKLFMTSGGINWVNIAMGVAASAASVSSIAAGAEQVLWAGQIGNEISARETVGDYNDEVFTEYEAGVANYSAVKEELIKYETDT
ncbi:hypothetical protein IJD34_03750 [bacterium]|nr:hypothetical protein [bacterium]